MRRLACLSVANVELPQSVCLGLQELPNAHVGSKSSHYPLSLVMTADGGAVSLFNRLAML